MILQGVSFTCRPGSILIDDLHRINLVESVGQMNMKRVFFE